MRPILLMLLLLPPFVCGADMLTPAYYDGEAMSREANAFLAACQTVQMKHPLENSEGLVPSYDAPRWGSFGAGKGPTRTELDLDETDGLVMDGKTVKAGDLLSKNLYSGTQGGPHLHFEVRYYRPNDDGTEEFYGFRGPAPGAGEWPNGFWDPDTGYGFGHPESHGLRF